MDWSAGLTANSEIGVLKKALPIAFVLDYIDLPVEKSPDGRLHTTCPFHADHDPSFDVYPWQGGERWGCFVCGIGGDVLDLIQQIWPELGFRQAKEAAGNLIANMNAKDWTGPRPYEGIPWNEDRAAQMLEMGRQNESGERLLDEWLQKKGLLMSAGWLMNLTGVVIFNQSILIPYYDTSRTLVALKHRNLYGGPPIAMAGSKLTGVFYGDGLLQPPMGCDTTWLTEGETDTWTALWLTNGHNAQILGLPTGAGTRPFGIERIHGEEIIIAFDGDTAGIKGRKTWGTALEGRKIHPWSVPDGEDLTSFYRVQ